VRTFLAAARRWLDQRAGRDLGELVAISAEALGRYKLRTALSVLGVVLGVAAVIAMMSVSEGARQDALEQMALLGLDNLVVRNRGLSPSNPGWQKARGLTTGDAVALRHLVPDVEAVSPTAERYLNVGRMGRRRMARVIGVMPEYAVIMRLPLERGRFIAAPDALHQGRVCVLGALLARGLFAFANPLEHSVRVEGRWYRVVGVLASRASAQRGTMPAQDLNQAVIVPLPTLLERSLELDPRQRVDEIWLKVRAGERVHELGRITEHTLSRLHRGLPDFQVIVPRELLEQRYRTQRTFSVVVGSVAALSLLVGGIGIMNIMLASVLERTREIGVRRTVGATRRDITLQFLAESLLMTLSGGTAGIALGVVVSWLITVYASWTTRVSLMAVLLGFTVAVLVGLVFGIYPARQAAGLQPIDALRYE